MTKVCTKCGIEKPFSEFYNNRASKDGKTTRCKECEKVIRLGYDKRIRKMRDRANALVALRLLKKEKEREAIMGPLNFKNKGKKYTIEEENIILKMFHTHTAEEIAVVLERPVHTVVQKMYKMNIKPKRDADYEERNL